MPDPDNLLHWYFVIFGLDGPYEGGYYLGKVECPANFPQNAPNIRLLVKSGIFELNNKICMSMTDYHPESWNPAWSVTQVILGLVSFWYEDEYTAGAIYYSNNPDGKEKKKRERTKAAWESREATLNHEMFKKYLAHMAEYIGINRKPKVAAWAIFRETELNAIEDRAKKQMKRVLKQLIDAHKAKLAAL